MLCLQFTEQGALGINFDVVEIAANLEGSAHLKLLVTSVVPGSQAERLRVPPCSHVLSIDGTDTREQTQPEMADALRKRPVTLIFEVDCPPVYEHRVRVATAVVADRTSGARVIRQARVGEQVEVDCPPVYEHRVRVATAVVADRTSGARVIRQARVGEQVEVVGPLGNAMGGGEERVLLKSGGWVSPYTDGEPTLVSLDRCKFDRRHCQRRSADIVAPPPRSRQRFQAPRCVADVLANVPQFAARPERDWLETLPAVDTEWHRDSSPSLDLADNAMMPWDACAKPSRSIAQQLADYASNSTSSFADASGLPGPAGSRAVPPVSRQPRWEPEPELEPQLEPCATFPQEGVPPESRTIGAAGGDRAVDTAVAPIDPPALEELPSEFGSVDSHTIAMQAGLPANVIADSVIGTAAAAIAGTHISTVAGTLFSAGGSMVHGNTSCEGAGAGNSTTTTVAAVVGDTFTDLLGSAVDTVGPNSDKDGADALASLLASADTVARQAPIESKLDGVQLADWLNQEVLKSQRMHSSGKTPGCGRDLEKPSPHFEEAAFEVDHSESAVAIEPGIEPLHADALISGSVEAESLPQSATALPACTEPEPELQLEPDPKPIAQHPPQPSSQKTVASRLSFANSMVILDVPESARPVPPKLCDNCRQPMKKPRYCHYYGYFCCKSCHKDDKHIIPARLVMQWDAKKYPVCRKARNFLSSIADEPAIDLAMANPSLYTQVQRLEEIQTIRLKLRLMQDYVRSSRASANCRLSEIADECLGERGYFMEQQHQYSLRDLIQTAKGNQLVKQLTKTLSAYTEHITHCQTCAARGHVCEICGDDPSSMPIFPFQVEDTSQCTGPGCRAYFHLACYREMRTSGKQCPKCTRISTIQKQHVNAKR